MKSGIGVVLECGCFLSFGNDKRRFIPCYKKENECNLKDYLLNKKRTSETKSKKCNVQNYLEPHLL